MDGGTSGNGNDTAGGPETEAHGGEAENGETSSADAGDKRDLRVMVNGELVTLTGKAAYVFVDVFDVIHFDLKDSRGRAIVTKVNGHNAEYMEELKEGDSVEIYWEESGAKRS